MMTDYQLKRRAILAFANYEISKPVRRRYQRDWLKCVKALGDKWLYAKYIERTSYSPGGIGTSDGENGMPTSPTDDTSRSKPL